jgi:hypothetical protein
MRKAEEWDPLCYMSALLSRRQLTVIRLGSVRPLRLLRLVTQLFIEGWTAQISVAASRREELMGIRTGIIRHVRLLPIDRWVARISVADSRRWVLGFENLPPLLVPPGKLPAAASHKPAGRREVHFCQCDNHRSAFEEKE